MKQASLFILLMVLISGCSHVVNINYAPVDGGCVYSEIEKPRKYLFDYFGFRDTELYVNYNGLNCKDILQHELKYSVHKKPYNSISATTEVPALKVDVETGGKNK